MSEKKAEAPKLSNTVSATLDEATRTVTFTDRPQFAIHPVAISVPWAALKSIVGTILSHEAQIELNGAIKTVVSDQRASSSKS